MAIRKCLPALILAIVLTMPMVVQAQNPPIVTTLEYVSLMDQTEKWFTSDFPGKTLDLRLHTRVNGSFNGAVIEEHEILLGNSVIERHRYLYHRDDDADVYFHGDLDGRILAEPVLWVDAPLYPGKTWTDATPAFDNGIDPTEKIHYVFACLETENVVCPVGVMPAYRVFMATIYPDGHTTDCDFWYSEHCGLVRCSLENDRVYLLHKVIPPDTGDGRDISIDDPLPGQNQLGSYGSPNPANPMVTLRFRLPQDTPVSLGIYDISGRLVRTLADALPMTAGDGAMVWNGVDDSGRPAASGIYVYRLRAGALGETGRVTLVR